MMQKLKQKRKIIKEFNFKLPLIQRKNSKKKKDVNNNSKEEIEVFHTKYLNLEQKIIHIYNFTTEIHHRAGEKTATEENYIKKFKNKSS